MLVLGIESTCDETAASVVKDGEVILSNVVSSQIDLHKEFGGVVPELASRRHLEIIIPVIEEALAQAHVTLDQVDVIAAAYAPGLIGSLMVGVQTAKTLALALKKPLVGVHHLEAHLYAALMSHPGKVEFPALGVLLSGGHTSILYCESLGNYRVISETVDDSIGEAFDKTAKILGLPYPGGPEIERLAKSGNPRAFPFKPGHVKENPLSFSFSGLKTAVLYAVQKLDQITEKNKQDIAASFQNAAFRDVIQKITAALSLYPANNLIFGGGVINSQTLRAELKKKFDKKNLFFPDLPLTLDNAAMIAGLGFHRYKANGGVNPLELEAKSSIPLKNSP